MRTMISAYGIDATVEQAVTGDEAAFARIVAAHHDDMLRVAFLVVGDADLAKDAVQVAWTHVWRKLGSLRDVDRLRPWLLAVAANEARRQARTRWRRTVREITVDAWPDASDDGEGDVGRRDAHVDLRAALARLRPGERTLVALRYGAGLTSTEIGTALGITGGGVRARLARVLDRLRKDLGDA